MKELVKKGIAFVLSVAIVMLGCVTSFAKGIDKLDESSGLLVEYKVPNFQDDQSIELNRNSDGSFSGESTIYGVTAVSCFLSGNTGGIDELYEIYIRWSGGAQVIGIKASNLKISSLNSSATYFSDSFSVDCHLESHGTAAVRTCYIPNSVKTVRIKTTNLMTYFAYENIWLSTGEINGTYTVN